MQTRRRASECGRGIEVLYVSPLKALVHDVERNLQLPLSGIRDSAARAGLDLQVPRVSLRTGDTAPKQRREQARDPGQIFVTTPESLYLLLGSRAREHLRSVQAVIVDEVHALAGEKRGAHLALSLERLSQLCAKEPQRIGLSATAKPLGEIARFLGGDRPVTIVDASARAADRSADQRAGAGHEPARRSRRAARANPAADQPPAPARACDRAGSRRSAGYGR